MGGKLILDVETQREFAEVEGRKPELLGVSVVGVYHYSTSRYEAYVESELPQLAPILKDAELVIGFNNAKFDMPVLQPYLPFPISTVPVLDILEEVVKNLGHRVSLDSIAQATLGRGKSGSGLDALKWYKEGKIDLIKKYCLDDVKLTKEVYEYGKKHGKLHVTSRFGGPKMDVPVLFIERKRDVASITKLLLEAFAKKLQVEIDYLSQSVASGESSQRIRCVDVYHVKEPYFEGFDHFRNDIRQFRIDRILEIKPTWKRYSVPPNYIPVAIPE